MTTFPLASIFYASDLTPEADILLDLPKKTLYTGNADQAAMCGDALLVRTGGSIVRVAGGQSATIRKDGAMLMGVYGQKIIQLTSRGVITCDVNGENATTILYGSFEAMSIANGVLYVGDAKGYTQQVTL